MEEQNKSDGQKSTNIDEVFDTLMDKLKKDQVDLTKFTVTLYQFYPKAIYDPTQFKPGDFEKRKANIPNEINQVKQYIDVIKPKLDEIQKVFYLKFLTDFETYVPEEYKPLVMDIIRNYFPRDTSDSRCYIATMCYQDIDSKQVMAFRLFRDKYLLNNKYGTSLTEQYYKYSPSIVTLLQNKIIVTKTIKFILDIIYYPISLLIKLK